MLHKYAPHLGWPVLIFIVVLPIVLWLIMIPLDQRFEGVYETLTSLGRLTGIVAATLFCIAIILTARLRFVETMFGGLNRVYIAHHIVGGVALIVLLAHPLLLALRATITSVHAAALQLLPFGGTPAKFFGVVSLWLFIALMVITFYANLPYRVWLITHKLIGLVLLGMVFHVLLVAHDVADFLPLTVFSWGIFVAAGLVFIARTLLPKFFARRYKYKIWQVHTMAPGVVRIVMMPVTKALSFTSGQFVFASFRAPHFSAEWHPFSITSNAHDQGLAITVKAVGTYTALLAEQAPRLKGTTVIIEGAYGRFVYQNFTYKRQVWIAGGIGITPFLSMIPDVQPGYTIDLYYSAKTASEVMNWSFLEAAAAQSGGAVRVFPVLADRDGLLTAERIQQISGSLNQADILICGPPPMMHALHDQFIRLGLKRKQIHTEEFAMS